MIAANQSFKWAVQVRIAEPMAEDFSDSVLQALMAPRFDTMVRDKLAELSSGGQQWQMQRDGGIKVARHMIVPTHYDALDEDGNPYNTDGSEVIYETQSFVRETVKFIPPA